ncbi:hypothetical protein D918_06061 [Trichuris suis]|nr:hypothetical protein D918_06061 [Trichuris suis]
MFHRARTRKVKCRDGQCLQHLRVTHCQATRFIPEACSWRLQFIGC